MDPTHRQLTAALLSSRHSLYAFIYGFVRSTHDAEDIFQEVWLRFTDALRNGVEIRDPARWCRGVARNVILHYWRDRRTAKVVIDQELFDVVEQAFAEQDPHQDYWQSRQQALADCVQSLPAHSRELLQLKYDQDLSAEEVATRTSRTAAAVLMALSRIRRILRDCADRKLNPQGA